MTAPRPGRRQLRLAGVAGRAILGLAVPALLYYPLRALGASVYLALLVSTALSALPALYSLLRHRRLDGVSTYFAAMLLGGLLVSLLPGNSRFLLARESVMTGVTGAWFLAGAWRGQPLAYVLSKPLLQGRFRWPDHWDNLWVRSLGFRRMWRTSSVIFGIGLIVDAGLRVLMAYTLPPDSVPGLGVALSIVTTVALNIAVHVYYAVCRIHDPSSPVSLGTVDPAAPRLSDAHARGPLD